MPEGTRVIIIATLYMLATPIAAGASAVGQKSTHFGFMHPDGVDVIGYTVERPVSTKIYKFTTFGIPSIAAIGLAYYRNYHGNGLNGVIGIGLGSVLYGSLAYQFQVTKTQFLKAGAGLTTGVAYSGVYPVIAYEYRF